METNGHQSPGPEATSNGNGIVMETTQGDMEAPVARLCHIVKWQHFDGYGFNLHAEKGKPGQMIGKVDEGSPAEAAGLKEGDRIVEVNGVNIANENHKQVVQRIKAVEDETKLLVVDAEADKYFKANNIVIKSNLPNVVLLKTPPSPASSPAVNGKNKNKNDERQTDTPSSDRKNSLRSLESSPEPELQGSQGDSGRSSANGTLERKNNTLNLNMTAAEFRAQLASRKSTKYEVKKESIDFKQKSDIIQKL